MLWKMLKTFDAGWSNRRHFMNGGLGVGCPPVGGFFSKFFIFAAAAAKGDYLLGLTGWRPPAV